MTDARLWTPIVTSVTLIIEPHLDFKSEIFVQSGNLVTFLQQSPSWDWDLRFDVVNKKCTYNNYLLMRLIEEP